MSKNCCTFAPAFVKSKAQMAESVDALVSNTSGAIRAGSTPALGTSEETALSEVALQLEALRSSSFQKKSIKSSIFFGFFREEKRILILKVRRET